MNVIYNLSFSVALTTSTKLNDAFFIACIMMVLWTHNSLFCFLSFLLRLLIINTHTHSHTHMHFSSCKCTLNIYTHTVTLTACKCCSFTYIWECVQEKKDIVRSFYYLVLVLVLLYISFLYICPSNPPDYISICT